MQGEESCSGEGGCWQPPNELVRGRGVSHCEADIGENMSIGRSLQDNNPQLVIATHLCACMGTASRPGEGVYSHLKCPHYNLLCCISPPYYMQ